MARTDQIAELVSDHGVNRFDVAPTYRDAEPKLRQHRGTGTYRGLFGC